jgi:hypothetical protein
VVAEVCVALPDLVHDCADREPLAGHVGKSGALLERLRLPDGRTVVVKRVRPSTDLILAGTGATVSWEHVLRESGLLDRLPDGIGHAVLDSWVEGDETVIVMRDLGSAVLTWEDRLDVGRCAWLVDRVAALHRAFLGAPLAGLAPLDRLVSLFTPDAMRRVTDGDNPLPRLSRRGWEIFPDLVPADVAAPVQALLDDVGPLVRALRSRPLTLTHGDLATVNVAVEGDDLVLLDWLPCASPGAVDIARFVAGCSSVVDMSREELLAAYRDAAGPAYDEEAMHLALLAGLVWLGWNKALDAAGHPDPALRERERADLAWWTDAARTTLEKGYLSWT